MQELLEGRGGQQDYTEQRAGGWGERLSLANMWISGTPELGLWEREPNKASRNDVSKAEGVDISSLLGGLSEKKWGSVKAARWGKGLSFSFPREAGGDVKG